MRSGGSATEIEIMLLFDVCIEHLCKKKQWKPLSCAACLHAMGQLWQPCCQSDVQME